ncbi:MAG: indolepyruvate ferredoxin oxidoreductase subunit alpha [Bacillota bacterium]
MKVLLTGNEAVARGAYEAGIAYAAAYPGSPTTEILENIANYKEEIIAEWAPNEKVALESAIGASIAGARSLAAMKQVGVNVAADPLLTLAYTGVNGGTVLITGDDPGPHGSQNEQDNRYYAKFAKVAMVEPSDSQEAKDMIKTAMEISEKYDTLVLMRMTTRICNSKTIVELGERKEVGKKPYSRNLQKYDATPVAAKRLRMRLEEKLKELEAYSNETELNYVEWHDKKIGIISSGAAYQYAKEVFGENASYLKLGFTYPLPMKKIKEFAENVETLYVIEELEPFMEEQIKAAGIACIGKEKIPNMGELNPEIVAKVLLNEERPVIDYDSSALVRRPVSFCPGCPHRGFFYELGKKQKVMITGDVGCYGLSGLDPINVKDTCLCMGASISMGHGAQKVFNKFNEDMRTVSVIGDATFFHTGINSLLDVVYNRSNTITCILDNRTTALTGQQENPGSGFTLQGMPTKPIEIAPLVKAMGINGVRTVNPLKLHEVKEALDWALGTDEPAVIITRWPCPRKKLSQQDKEEFGDYKGSCEVEEEKCTGCKLCMKTGCPALVYHKETETVKINKTQCVGCQVCLQVCPANAIGKMGK